MKITTKTLGEFLIKHDRALSDYTDCSLGEDLSPQKENFQKS